MPEKVTLSPSFTTVTSGVSISKLMPITVKVVSLDEYETWLKEAKQKFAKEESEVNIKIVKKVFKGEKK